MGFQCKDGYGLGRVGFTTTVNLKPLGSERFCMHASCCVHELFRHSHTRSCVRVSNQFVPVAHLAALGWPAYKVSGSPDAPRLCVCRACVCCWPSLTRVTHAAQCSNTHAATVHSHIICVLGHIKHCACERLYHTCVSVRACHTLLVRSSMLLCLVYEAVCIQ